jgi:hypothetical protein
MGADEIQGLDNEVHGTLQKQRHSEAEKRRRKLEEDIKKEQAERIRKRDELLKKEDEYEKVMGINIKKGRGEEGGRGGEALKFHPHPNDLTCV